MIEPSDQERAEWSDTTRAYVEELEGLVGQNESWMWCEFYTLSEDCGIRFKVTQVSLCGQTMRVELPPNPKDPYKERWHFVAQNEQGNWQLHGRDWTDLGFNCEGWEHFEEVDSWQVEGLQGQ